MNVVIRTFLCLKCIIEQNIEENFSQVYFISLFVDVVIKNLFKAFNVLLQNCGVFQTIGYFDLYCIVCSRKPVVPFLESFCYLKFLT